MEFNIYQIIKMLPHSYPFLLIDKIVECNPNEDAIAIKCVTFNEPFFTGHFHNNPIMPGVLIIESMAQTCAICAISGISSNETQVDTILTSIEKARFRRMVIPGDVLKISVKVINQRDKVCKFECIATVEETKVSEATIMAMMQIK